MDFIWVPDAGGNSSSSNPRHGKSLSPEFVLFLCGWVLLSAGAFLGTSWMREASAQPHGLGPALGMLAHAHMVGFLFQNIAAVIGTLKTKSPGKKVFVWFLATQALACGLLELASLH